jgi:carbon monoxide dehydrogenase subunit G
MTAGDLVDIAHQVPGRVRFRLHIRPAGGALVELERTFRATSGVRSVRVNEAAASVVVEFDGKLQSVERLLTLPVAAVAEPAAQAKVDESMTIAAPAETIWSALNSFNGLPSDEGAPAIEEAGKDEWRLTMQLLGQPLAVRIKRVEEEPPRRMVFRLAGALHGHCVFSLTPGSHGTRVREQVTYTLANGLMDRAFGGLADAIIRRMARDQLAALRQTLLDESG